MRLTTADKPVFLVKIAKTIWVFYTFWAWVIYILFALKLLPNPRVIAVFVFIISQYVLFFGPAYIKKYGYSGSLIMKELTLHYVPLILIPYDISRYSWLMFFVSLGCYLAIHRGNVIRYYADPRKTMGRIWK